MSGTGLHRMVARGRAGRTLYLAVSLAVALSFLLPALAPLPRLVGAVVLGATIHVPEQFSTIQEAVNAAAPGDTIIVGDGTYYENVNVDRAVTIRAARAGFSDVVAADPNDHVFEVSASNVTIDGFDISGGWAGIGLASYANVEGSRFVRNAIWGNFYAVMLDSGAYQNVVSDNYLGQNQVGVYVLSATYNEVSWNTISQNAFGVYTGLAADNNTFSYNTVSFNSTAFYMSGGAGNHVYLNNISDNGEHRAGGAVWSSPEPVEYQYSSIPRSSYLGNRWGDYSGADGDGDGVGDAPYDIFTPDVDSYPLMLPFEFYLGPMPPLQPINVYPGHNATGLDLMPELAASDFLDLNPGDTHQASWWQITAASQDYINTVVDTGPNGAHLTSLTSWVEGPLLESTTYYWRVKYQDGAGLWSEWSDETVFTTAPSTPGGTYDLEVVWEWSQVEWAVGTQLPLRFTVTNIGGTVSPPFILGWEWDGVLQPEGWEGPSLNPQQSAGGLFADRALTEADIGQHILSVFNQPGAAELNWADNRDDNTIVVAPATTLPAPANLVKTDPDSDYTPGFAWDAVPGAVRYEASIDSDVWVPVGSDPAVQISIPLQDGEHLLRVRAIGEDGVPGPAAYLPFIVDTTPPGVTGLQPYPGDSFFDVFVHIEAGYSDSGSGIDPDSVRISIDGADVTPQSTVTPAGVAYDPPAPLALGRHNVDVSVQDKAGNTAAAGWFFDLVEQMRLPAPANPAKTDPDNDSTPAFTWEPVPGAASYEIAIGQDEFVPAGPDPAAQIATPLPDGEHLLRVRAVGEDGVPGQEAYLNFVVDTTPPSITDLLPYPGDSFFDVFVHIEAGYSDSGSGIDPDSVRISLDGADVTLQSTVTPAGVAYDPPAPLAVGRHNVNISLRDNAGNTAAAGWFFDIFFRHVYDLPAGWSMISLPLTPPSLDPRDVFGALPYFILYTWDSAAGAYVQPQQLQPGAAYWILLLEPAVVEVIGDPLQSNTVSLGQGWNMIGGPSAGVKLGDALVDPAGALFPLAYGWDPVNNRYYVTDFVQPGVGYWALAFEDATLSYSVTASPPAVPGVLQ